MALLQITQEMIDAAKRPEEGYYECEIVATKDEMSKGGIDPKTKKVKEPTMMCICSVQLTKRVEDGADVEGLEKKKDVYIVYKYAAMSAQFICAALNVASFDALVGQSVDLQSVLNGKKLQARVVHKIFKKNDSDKGMEVWEFDGFLPIGQIPF